MGLRGKRDLLKEVGTAWDACMVPAVILRFPEREFFHLSAGNLITMHDGAGDEVVCSYRGVVEIVQD